VAHHRLDHALGDVAPYRMRDEAMLRALVERDLRDLVRLAPTLLGPELARAVFRLACARSFSIGP
jgi:hypothetical protein